MTATSPPGVAAAEYRRLMGAVPTGVAVLALHDAAREPAGLTVNAVASVSLSPPVLLVCVHRQARVRPLLQPGTPFVLNVLSSAQEPLARRFAGTVADRFTDIEYAQSADGALISGAVAYIQCSVREIGEAGDHSVIFADVTGGQLAGGTPLVFSRGAYTSTSDSARRPPNVP